MISWSDSARRHLEQYLAGIRASSAADGADPDEVVEDLHRHIEQELLASGVRVATVDDLQRVLLRVGGVGGAVAMAVEPTLPQQPPALSDGAAMPERPRPPMEWVWPTLVALFAVLLPLSTLVIETVTRICAHTFYNPLPHAGFAVFVLAVPVINAISLWSIRRGARPRRELMGWLNGFAIGASTLYAIIFLPLTPLAVLAILLLGLGLLPLAPLFAFFGAISLRRAMRRSLETAEPLPGLRGGILASTVVFGVLCLPSALNSLGLQLARSAVAERRQQGLSLLRAVGNEQMLENACGPDRVIDPIDYLLTFGFPVSAAQTQEVYYRLTGRMPHPQRGRSLLPDWGNDANQGQAVVGAMLDDVALAESRLDATAEAGPATAYMEWTLVFRNDGPFSREARAQIALPPGGVVSRLTLWINNEERDAAFGKKAQVEQAYQEVAVVQNRDPIVVTTLGPDRILMRCFPIPPNGRMKVRMGITAPVALASLAEGRLALPTFLERNFELNDVKRQVWIESASPVSDSSGVMARQQPGASRHVLRDEMAETDLNGPPSLRVERNARANTWSAADPSTSGRRIVQRAVAKAGAAPIRHLVIVVDGSAAMGDTLKTVQEALLTVPAEMAVSAIIAADDPVWLDNSPQPASAERMRAILRQIRETRFRGGMDNVPGLCAAWDRAAQQEGSAVLWLHGPQPVPIGGTAPLRQRIERQRQNPQLFEMQLTPGRNRVVEDLDDIAALSAVPRLGEAGEDLRRWFEEHSTAAQGPAMIREVVEGDAPAGAKEASAHLVRLWAADEVRRLCRIGTPVAREKATSLAVQHHLVTPVSGAVVLETAQQYAQAGLKPVSADQIPVVPEPASILLFAAAGIHGLLRRPRRCRAA